MIPIGTRVRMTLLSSKDSDFDRMKRGITDKVFIGITCTELCVDHQFTLNLGFNKKARADELLTTSLVQKITGRVFHTMNSTYSLEILS